MSVPGDERADLVTTVLSDVLLHLWETQVPPRDLTRYLVSSLRNRARNSHRDRERRMTRDERAYSEQAGGRQRIVAESHSEYGIRTAGPPDMDETPRLALAIEKLARRSAQALEPLDAVLMLGLSRHVPLRDLAERAGTTYGAARVRVHRLRERFLKLARQYVATLDADERREMERFFRRAGIVLCADDEGKRPRGPRDRPMPAEPDGGDERR